jgi:hypothetical protein
MTKPKKNPKDNKSYLHLDRPDEKNKAQQALAKAKALEAKKMANGKKWVRVDHKTEVLR